jgi:N-hydroxyarylamine O-acetyltransferase
MTIGNCRGSRAGGGKVDSFTELRTAFLQKRRIIRGLDNGCEETLMTSLNFDAYCKRIQYDGGTSPTFETLAGLLLAHTSKIPFENLDVLLHRPVRLDLDSVQGKLVRAGRGGYCFEHATLFAAVLETLGFQPARHAGRVVLFAPYTEVPRGHMFLTVPVEGTTFVVDPGFGPFSAPVPVPLVDGDTARADGRSYWMAREGDLWTLYVPRDDQAVAGWVTTLEMENRVDFEVANHFTATHPGSPFVNWIMLSAATPEGRINVMNRDVTILHGREVRTTKLSDRAALRALLAMHFGFDLPEVEQLAVPAVPEWQ